MAYISPEYGFAFFAAPATGSSAIINALESAGIGEYWPPDEVVADGRRIAPSKHSTMDNLRAANIADKVEPLFKLVGVRNMFSWYVAKFLRNRTSRMRNINNKKSWIYELPITERDKYINKLERQYKMTFAEFLHDTLDRHQEIDVHQAFHAGMDMYLHQEILDQDFESFRKIFSLPAEVVLKKFNVTGAMNEGKTYRDFYTPELIEYLYTKNRSFFRLFPEYSFDGIDITKCRPAAQSSKLSMGIN